jgi:antitoxin StbD
MVYLGGGIMLITNVTEIRNNVGRVIKKATSSKEPVLIMQRSKPVAYILEKSRYEEMQKKIEQADEWERKERIRQSIENITMIRENTKEYGYNYDSTSVIRQLRENSNCE